MIIFYTDPITYDGKYLNKDKQNDYGVELETELKMGKKVKWVNNITYVNGEGTMDNQKIKNIQDNQKEKDISKVKLQKIKRILVCIKI